MKAHRRVIVHLQDQRFPSRALCGRSWAECRGGRLASSTNPPVVFDEERKSANPLDCRKCLELHLKALGTPKAKR